jgi:hypothetical protein
MRKNLRLVVLFVLFIALLIPTLAREVQRRQMPVAPDAQLDLDTVSNDSLVLRGKLVQFAPSGPVGETMPKQNCSPCSIYLPLPIRNHP